MILAFTGAGISRASGIPTFDEQPGLRDRLSRSFARVHPKEFQTTIAEMQAACDNAAPNDAHLALAEYDVPIITMNVDGLHQKAGFRHVLEIHGGSRTSCCMETPPPVMRWPRTGSFSCGRGICS